MTEKEALQRALRRFDTLVASDLLQLLTRYPARIVNEHSLPPQVIVVVEAEVRTSVFSRDQLVLLLSRHWEWLQSNWQELSKNALLHGTYRKQSSGRCPFCDARVRVEVLSERIQCDQCDYAFDSNLLEF